MKKCASLLIVLFLTGCACKKTTSVAASEKTGLTTPCPEEGTCQVKLLKNKKIEFKMNEATGKFYHVLSDSNEKHVVQYEYTKIVDTTLADAEHTETLTFEVDANNPEIELNGKALQQSNMIFGRFCFCRGATGIYKVYDGNLSVKKDQGKLKVAMDFKITEVPQIINSFSAILQ